MTNPPTKSPRNTNPTKSPRNSEPTKPTNPTKAPKPTKPTKGKSPSTTLQQSTIKSAKAEVLGLEKTNLRHLILWRSNEKWWKMCGHSALIYAYHVGPNLLDRSDISIHIDTDRYHHDPDGVVSIHDIDNFTTKMQALGIKRSKDSTEHIVIFTLPTALSKDSIENFRREESGNRKKINEVLYASIKNQYLESEIRKATEAIFKKVKKLSQDRYQFVGEPLYHHAITLFSIKNRLARGDATEEDAYKELKFHTGELMCLLDLAYELNFFSTTEIATLARHLHDIHTILTKELHQN